MFSHNIPTEQLYYTFRVILSQFINKKRKNIGLFCFSFLNVGYCKFYYWIKTGVIILRSTRCRKNKNLNPKRLMPLSLSFRSIYTHSWILHHLKWFVTRGLCFRALERESCVQNSHNSRRIDRMSRSDGRDAELQGWRRETRQRQSGRTAGRVDVYIIRCVSADMRETRLFKASDQLSQLLRKIIRNATRRRPLLAKTV